MLTMLMYLITKGCEPSFFVAPIKVYEMSLVAEGDESGTSRKWNGEATGYIVGTVSAYTHSMSLTSIK